MLLLDYREKAKLK